MGYRPEFKAALRMFAKVSEAMARRGYTRPVLVGGRCCRILYGKRNFDS